MSFYSLDIYIRLIISIVPAIFGIYLFFNKKEHNLSLPLILLTGFLLRFVMISADNFLFDWDERFHALVAKNMINYPFKPMLRLNPISPYQLDAWCCNHVWVHKQPIFLWQMALSMKIFGVNLVALRLPSALMGTVSIFFIYSIASFWTKDNKIAFLSCLLFCFSYYQLELTSGRFPLDNNDVAFSFYVTASFWAFINYIQNKNIKWVVLVGFFAGCSILVKWLTGLLIFGGWGIYLILNKNSIINYWNYLLSIIICIAVFLPWQLYIKHYFPLETANSYAHNFMHITDDLGHPGSYWYHINFLKLSYGFYLVPFIVVGIITMLYDKLVARNITIIFLSMIFVVYTFFSIIVKTKMEALPYPVNSLIWILISYGLFKTYHHFYKLSGLNNSTINKNYSIVICVIILCVFNLKPWEILAYRSIENTSRNIKISNTQIYKNLDSNVLKDRVILNCNSFEDNELMFYQNINAYQWYPQKNVLDSLLNKGYKFAAFESHGDYQLPSYITENKDIMIIHQYLK
jgi:4-amino-4-deoxy-L-arabinose transferase-like glycosyltransferase